MSVRALLRHKLEQAFEPAHLELVNESHMHRTPPGSESHFKLILVSDAFQEKRLLQRHRLVNDVLAQELSEQIHALAMHTYTQAEWSQRQQQVPNTPSCLGG